MEEAGLENKKKKISLGNIIILIILLLVLGFAISYFASDELELVKCKESKDCVKYQVFSIKGDQYVCINNQSVEDDSSNIFASSKGNCVLFNQVCSNSNKFISLTRCISEIKSDIVTLEY
jgi:hypothetical protein